MFLVVLVASFVPSFAGAQSGDSCVPSSKSRPTSAAINVAIQKGDGGRVQGAGRRGRASPWTGRDRWLCPSSSKMFAAGQAAPASAIDQRESRCSAERHRGRDHVSIHRERVDDGPAHAEPGAGINGCTRFAAVSGSAVFHQETIADATASAQRRNNKQRTTNKRPGSLRSRAVPELAFGT